MRNLHLYSVFLTLWIPFNGASASDDSLTWIDFRSETRTAVENGNAQRLQALLPSLEDLDHAPPGWVDYWSAYLQYRLALLSETPADSAPPLQACIDHAGSAATVEDPKDQALRAEALALLGACHSSMAGTGPTAGMQHGPRAAMLRDESLLIAPDNPRALLLAGAQDVWTPVQWGGSPERAVRRLERAMEGLDEARPSEAWQPRWGRSDAIGHLALALGRLDRGEDARRLLDQARADGEWNGWLDSVNVQLKATPSD